MNRIRSFVAYASALALAAILAGCSSISYNYDYDPGINFTTLKTYAWIQTPDTSNARRFLGPLIERRIVRAIDENLAAKGYEKATTGRPDFLVNFYGGTQEKVDVTTYYSGWGYYGWYGGTSVDVRQWTEGTLVIDFIDAKEKDLAWRGYAQGAVDRSQRDPEEVDRRISEVVRNILKKFPPPGE